MSHISYSEFRIWNECPYKHKLKYLDKVYDFQGSEHTAFGTAIHSVCENSVVSDTFDKAKHFREAFANELAKLPEATKENLNQDLIDSMYREGPDLAEGAVPALESYFGNFEVVSTEEGLYESMENFDSQIFKGYIDLVIKTEDGKHHILDWKPFRS